MMWFVSINIFAQLFEWLMIFMHKEGALSKSAMDKIAQYRRIITLISEAVGVLLLILIYKSSDDNIVEFLVQNPCSEDAAINLTFGQIDRYFKDSTKRLWINMGFLIVIFLADLTGLAEKL